MGILSSISVIRDCNLCISLWWRDTKRSITNNIALIIKVNCVISKTLFCKDINSSGSDFS